MADRISSFPDAVLCHILSFLPTKESVATRVLSKRWKPLWRSVPTLHFEEGFVQRIETHSRFVQSVYAFILSRYLDQPLQRFHVQCPSSLCDPVNFHAWINAALQQRLEHFHLCLTRQTTLVLPPCSVVFPASLLPSSLFNCKTLVVLLLIGAMNKNIFSFDLSSVDLPSLKAMHLQGFILERRDLAELLRGSYNLEDLVMRDVFFFESEVEPEFERLPKLVRAMIGVDNVPFEVVSNVEFLRIESMRVKDLIPEFQNLTHLGLSYLEYNEDWAGVFEMLKHCPKLQSLAIDEENTEMVERGDEGAGWPYPQSVPLCISLHLKTCSLRTYGGSKGEFRFARYIMQNARHLHTMAIYTVNANRQEKHKMLKKLSLCTRGSTVCKLSFK